MHYLVLTAAQPTILTPACNTELAKSGGLTVGSDGSPGNRRPGNDQNEASRKSSSTHRALPGDLFQVCGGHACVHVDVCAWLRLREVVL